MATDEKFTGHMHEHKSVALCVSDMRDGKRMKAMLEQIDEHLLEGSTILHTIGIAVDMSGKRPVTLGLCKGCVAAAAEHFRTLAGILDDLVALPHYDDN